MFKRIIKNTTKPIKFKSIPEIENFYFYDFSDIHIEKDDSFIIDLFNNLKPKFNSKSIDECLLILYYYYTFPDEKIFLDFLVQVEDTSIIFKDDIRIILLKASFYKRNEQFQSMINCYERGIELHSDLRCMKALSEYYKFINPNKSLSYSIIYYKNGGGNNYDLYLHFKEYLLKDEMFDCLIQGIKQDEEKCFEEIISLYYNDENKLKNIFMKIGNIKNKTIEYNLHSLIDRIKHFDNNFFEKLINSKKLISFIFQDEYINIFIFISSCLILIAYLIKD